MGLAAWDAWTAALAAHYRATMAGVQYVAAKAGVEAFTHSLAVEVAPLGIIVNGVTPGLGETGLNVTTTEEHKEGFRRMSALHRLCTPQDVAPVVAFLASDMCSYMVGQWIRLATF